jgi:hypothetical protein
LIQVQNNAPVAQLVEHLIEDQGVGGSNPSGSTIIFFAGISRVNTFNYYADVAELVDALVLGTSVQKTWGFESLHPHQISEIGRGHRSRTMLQGTL